MSQQPTWRGHRAPVEDPDAPGVPASPVNARGQRRWPVIVLGVVIAVAIAAAFALIALEERGESALPEIEVGTCLRSADLARGESSLTALAAVPCRAEHDAEVFAVLRLASGEELDDTGVRCVAFANDHDLAAQAVQARELEVRPLALTDEPSPGDMVACFIRRQDGTPRRGAVFTTTTESDR